MKKNSKSLLVDNAYDDIKNMISISRNALKEQEEVETDEFVERKKKEKSKDYTISGGKIIVHGTSDKDLILTAEEKSAFQETMDGFIEQVADLVDFGILNIYENNIEWSGSLIKFDIEFFYAVGETNGVYLNGSMIKIDEDFSDMLEKLTSYYEIFSTKWAQVLASRKKTEEETDQEFEV
tara:strand:+ start:109 stop:648 length:540 start_codon:yes stop_codon:yes gene_type:complete